MRFLLSLTALALAGPAFAASEVGAQRTFGIGISAGSTVSGASIKLHDRTMSYQAVVGAYGPFSNFGDVFGFGIDWLAEVGSFVETDALDLAFSLGVGGVLGITEPDLEAGVNGVAGLEFLIDPIPVDLVFEYKPVYFLTPDVVFEPVAFAGHARVWF